MGEERENIPGGDDREMISSDEVEGHTIATDEREAVSDDEVEGHSLPVDNVSAE